MIESGNDIKLDKDLDLTQTVQGFRDQRQRVSVLNSDCVEASVVYAETKTSFRFLYKENRYSEFRMTDSDKFFT